MLRNPNISRTPNSDIFKPINNKVDIAIFSAMKEEMEYIENTMCNHVRTVKIYDFNFNIYCYHDKKILLACTGFGTTFSASVLTLVYQTFCPDYVFLTGTSGGICSNLKIRDVVIAEEAFEAEVQTVFNSVEGTPFESCLTHPLNNKKIPHTYSANTKLLDIAKNTFINDPAINIGRVVSSTAFPSPLDLYESIKLNDPLSIDMETSAFYQISWLLNIPALAIRGISNKLKSNGTDDQINTSDLNGGSKAACIALLKIIDHLIYTFDNKINLEKSSPEIKDLIISLNLKPHPEGGMYTRVYESETKVISVNEQQYNNESRHAGTSIYYMLQNEDFSAWHSLKSDEIWHYYKGSSVLIHVIDSSGNLETNLLGDSTIDKNACFQVIIPRNTWFAAENKNKNSYSLVGCTVNPGFEFKDFKLATRDELTSLFPQHTDIITKYSRDYKRQKLV